MDETNLIQCKFLKLLETCDSHSIIILLLTIYPELNINQPSHIISNQHNNTESVEKSLKSMTLKSCI